MDKRKVAALLKRVPWTGYIAQSIWRIWQPWVTVGVVGAVFNDAGKLLVVEHVFHPKYPWGLPGGWMNRGEDPDETVRREIREETALHVEVVKPLIVARTPYLSRHLDMAYLCYAPPDAGEIILSSELLAYRWIDPSEFESLQPRALPMPRFHSRVIEFAGREHELSQLELSCRG